MDLKAATQQFGQVWSSISLRQRMSIGIVLLCVAGGLVFFTNWRREQDFRPLFTGMNAEDAGAIVAKLKESAIEYRVTDNGGSLMVPSSRVGEVRLQMAAAGLPRTGRIGFELFDKTSLGSTDFAEQVNYRRALEGELERTIRTISEVEQARVHLTFPKDSVFLESRLPAKASVLLTIKPAAQLTAGNINAIVHLVASAVEGLAPEAVSITDSQGNLLNKPKKAQTAEQASDESIEYRQKLERDLLAKVSATLDPLLGAGKYRAGMSVDCDFTSGEQSEEVYDPEKSVMLTTQKTEEMTGSASSGGVPGTASSLPRPVARSSSGSGGVTRRTENVNYQTSKTVRRLRLPQGSVKRISASVLLDQAVRWELKDGKQQKILVPPPPETVQAIREVVSAALGLVPDRGDQLVIQSLPFETTLERPAPPVPGSQPADASKEPKPAIPGLPAWTGEWRVLAGGGAVVMMAGLAFLFRRKKKANVMTATADPALTAGAGSKDAAAIGSSEAPAVEGLPANSRLLLLAQEKIAQTARVQALVEEIRKGVNADSALAVRVLRSWMEEVHR